MAVITNTTNATSVNEEWRDVEGWENFYQVSDLGRVRTKPRIDTLGRPIPERIRRPPVSTNGYCLVTLWNSGASASIMVHRMVMRAFVGACPDKMEVCHNNGIKTDNRLANLRYDTRSNNAHDRKAHGTQSYMRGENCGRSKLTESDVKEILARGRDAPLKVIGERYGVTMGAIHAILKGENWSHLHPDPIRRR